MMNRSIIVCCVVLFFTLSCSNCFNTSNLNEKSFPDNFEFGVATSAFQIEGAWNESGKGESIWDRFIHTNPDLVEDHKNADVSCDSYHKFRDDVALIKELGVNFYKFSISWPRVLPTGFLEKINEEAVQYYHDLLDELLANNISAMVTIYHWDLPQPLQDLGGWPNQFLIDLLEDFANFLFQTYGSKVKYWITFNEPCQICLNGYGFGTKAPGKSNPGIGEYLCSYTLLKAHARVYHLYDHTYRNQFNGKIGISFDGSWMEPNSSSEADVAASQRAMDFTLGWFANPIFGEHGDYPPVMREFIDKRSKEENFPLSRLPNLTNEEVEYIRGTSDFFAFNHFTTKLIKDIEPAPIGDPSYNYDVRIQVSSDPSWEVAASPWLHVVPWGLQKLLKWIKDRYDNPEIFITANGYSDVRYEVNDTDRIEYHQMYLSKLLDAIHEDEIKVRAYTVWSLLDNFEWLNGYRYKFGLYSVDFDNPDKNRTAKQSAMIYQKIVRNKSLFEPERSGTVTVNSKYFKVLIAFIALCKTLLN